MSRTRRHGAARYQSPMRGRSTRGIQEAGRRLTVPARHPLVDGRGPHGRRHPGRGRLYDGRGRTYASRKASGRRHQGRNREVSRCRRRPHPVLRRGCHPAKHLRHRRASHVAGEIGLATVEVGTSTRRNGIGPPGRVSTIPSPRSTPFGEQKIFLFARDQRPVIILHLSRRSSPGSPARFGLSCREISHRAAVRFHDD